VDPEAPEVRASDDERERTAAALGDAAAEGRLTLEELTERLDAAYAARSRGELETLTADLPQRAPSRAAPRRKAIGVLGGTELRGRFRVEGVLTVVGVLGGVEIDLREAELVGHELELRCYSALGGVEITVPEGVDVSVELVTILGGQEVQLGSAPRPGAPLIRVTGFCALGGVEVRTHRERRGLLPRLKLP
jgi:hypothetical protein